MKTLADLKREIIGKKLILKEVDGIPKNDLRTCIKLQGDSFVFLKENGLSKTYTAIPKATLLEYDGKTIKIFRAGIRELNEREKEIIANKPKDDKQFEIDCLSDGNVMFNREKHYFKEAGFFYLFGTEKEQGKRLTYTDKVPMIEDDSIKGKLDLLYEVVKDV